MAILIAVINLYAIVILVRAVFSWLPMRHRRNVFYLFLLSITEPVLQPIRRLLPPMGGMDFSPLIVIVLCRLIVGLLRQASY